jgi:hypothetical protein
MSITILKMTLNLYLNYTIILKSRTNNEDTFGKIALNKLGFGNFGLYLIKIKSFC